MSGTTPAEHELPDIISVDDHVMEPRTLWQEQLPPSLREQGPRVSREKVKLEFSGGHYGFQRNVDDGDWCDVWLFEDAATPTGLLHGPAGIPRSNGRSRAARVSPASPVRRTARYSACAPAHSGTRISASGAPAGTTSPGARA